MRGGRGDVLPDAMAALTFWGGFRALVPFWPGAGLFGIVYAVAARAAGLTAGETLGMSVLVHAGSAQFAATGLIGGGAGPLAVTLATAVTNARYALMSTSIARYLARRPIWWRLLFAWQLSDESYAVAMSRFLAGNGTPAAAYGTNLSMIVPWLGGAVVGVLAGGIVPSAWHGGTDLVGPLIFLALLVPLLHNRRALLVAGIAGGLAVLGAVALPGASYLLLAGLGGACVGILLEIRGNEPPKLGEHQEKREDWRFDS